MGLRGVGKTVLLVKIRAVAEELDYRTLAVEAHEGKSLPDLLLPGLLSALQSLSMVEGAKERARRGLRVLKSFLNGIKVTVNDIELSIDSEVGAADSGDLETDLPRLFIAVGHAARAARPPLAILVDELQYLSQAEFSALIMSMHQVAQQNLPVILVGAGLPQILGLAGESKSYAERLFRYPKVGELTEEEGRSAILKPVLQEDARIDDDAISEILRISERYPYFIQQWAHVRGTWRPAIESFATTSHGPPTSTSRRWTTISFGFGSTGARRPSAATCARWQSSAPARTGPGTLRAGSAWRRRA